MKMKPSMFAALAGALGLGFFLMNKEEQPKALVPGAKYRLTVELNANEGANWQGLSEALSEMGVEDHKITGSGDTRTLTYTISPKQAVVMQPGMPLFQITSGDSYANSILKNVEALGRA